MPYSAKKAVFIFSFSGLQGREGLGRDGPGDEPGGWRGCPGTREFQGVGEGVQGGSANEFLAHRPFEFLAK